MHSNPTVTLHPQSLGHSVNVYLSLQLIYKTHFSLWRHGHFLAPWPSDTLHLSTFPLLIKRAQTIGTDHNYNCLLSIQLLLLLAAVRPKGLGSIFSIKSSCFFQWISPLSLLYDANFNSFMMLTIL